jgi:hypothetical protein
MSYTTPLRFLVINNLFSIAEHGRLVGNRGEFRPRQTRQLPRAVDFKGRFLFHVVVKC